jgi:REP element-mobilizing transposase RayT
MANTYTQIYIHVVFAVQERAGILKKEWREELFKYIAGILRNQGVKLLAIGGVEDHIHSLLALNPKIALSDMIRDVKANSSKFINEKGFVRGKFYWQEGFGAFSYSRSQIDKVAKYILNQEKHHDTKSFRDEYIEFLNKFEVDYDEKYLFKWIGDQDSQSGST